MKKLFIVNIFILIGLLPHAQIRKDLLFDSGSSLKIGLTISTREMRNTKNDTVRIVHMLYYQDDMGRSDSIKVSIRSRGNFRLQNCYFPPLWVYIKKKDAKGSLFEGQNKLKLVLPCSNNVNGNNLILKEFLCYKMYEVVSQFAFLTRLVDVDMSERSGQKYKKSALKGFFLEDPDQFAKRLNAKRLNRVTIAPAALNDTIASEFELFQFMISNTDWSVMHQHNSKLFVQDQKKFISIPYDFDMSGMVNAHYAVVSEVNGEKLAKDVTERIFRGYCHPPGIVQYVRQEFLRKKHQLLAVPDQLNGMLADKEIKRMKNYLNVFFDIINNDRLFKNYILDKCLEK
jgi:hypothetical protein